MTKGGCRSNTINIAVQFRWFNIVGTLVVLLKLLYTNLIEQLSVQSFKLAIITDQMWGPDINFEV